MAAILPIHFFKIILNTNLERLKIPNMFTRRYSVAGLSNPVILKTPDGTEWRVRWTKLNGEVWLEKGWKEFVENYSLEHGYVVLFKYEGTSVFDVVILDKSAVEIDYPFIKKEIDYPLCGENGDNLDQSDDESVQILDEWPNQMARQRSPSFSPRSHMIIKGEKNTQRRTSSLNWPREARAREVAEKFTSNNPFFTVFIKPAHVAKRQLVVCAPDLKGVIENKQKYVMLQIGKRSWRVKLLPYHSGDRHHRRLSAGWPLFVSESEVQPGDVCVFELINRQDPVFEVHVFKSLS